MFESVKSAVMLLVLFTSHLQGIQSATSNLPKNLIMDCLSIASALFQVCQAVFKRGFIRIVPTYHFSGRAGNCSSKIIQQRFSDFILNAFA
jgi:hypothetical protein